MNGKSEDFQLTITEKEISKIVDHMYSLPPVPQARLALDRDSMLVTQVLLGYAEYLRHLAVKPNFKVVISEDKV